MDTETCRYRESIVSKIKKPLQNAIIEEIFNNSREWSVLLKIVGPHNPFKVWQIIKERKG